MKTMLKTIALAIMCVATPNVLQALTPEEVIQANQDLMQVWINEGRHSALILSELRGHIFEIRAAQSLSDAERIASEARHPAFRQSSDGTAFTTAELLHIEDNLRALYNDLATGWGLPAYQG